MTLRIVIAAGFSAVMVLSGTGAAQTTDPAPPHGQRVKTPINNVRIPQAPTSRLSPRNFGTRIDHAGFGVKIDPRNFGVRLPHPERGRPGVSAPGPRMDPSPVDPGRRSRDPSFEGIKEPVTRANFPDVVHRLRRSEGCAGGACGVSDPGGPVSDASAPDDAMLTAPSPEDAPADAGLSPRARSALLAGEHDWGGAIAALAAHLESEPEDFAAARELAVLLVLAGDPRGAAGVMHLAHGLDPNLAASRLALAEIGIDADVAQELTRAALRSAERERTPAAFLLAAVVSRARGNEVAVKRLLARAEAAGLDAVLVASFAGRTGQSVDSGGESPGR